MIWLILACLLWGPSFGLIPILMETYGLDSYTLGVLRMTFALILFLPVFRPHKYVRKKRLMLTLLGGLQFGVMYLTLFLSYKFMKGYEVALVTIFTPLYVSILDHLLIRKNLRLRSVFCVLLAIFGAGLIRYARVETGSDFWIGFGIMQICNLSFALGQVLYRKLMNKTQRLEDMHVYGWLYTGALTVCILGWMILGDPLPSLRHLQSLPLPAWGIILWLGLIPSGLAFFMFNHGALHVDPHTLAIFNNLKIPIALVIALLIFRQQSAIEDWYRFSAGTFIMLTALWWNHQPIRMR
jgi:drug/metabolite transporter (DMT)-like permease